MMDLMNPESIMTAFLKIEDEAEKLIFAKNLADEIESLAEEQRKQAKENIKQVLLEVSRKNKEALSVKKQPENV